MSMRAAEIFSLQDRVAIVTGASSGLGERFARLLAEGGATVVAAARRGDRLDVLAGADERIEGCVCDVSRDEDLERLVAFTLERHGRIDVLVNNAGMGASHAAESEPLDYFRRVVDVNLTALFALTQLTARAMLERKRGSVINIASMFGLVGSAPLKQASYTASKGAVVNLTRELGAQWMRKGIRVNAIAPGFFPSEMTTELFADESSIAWLRRNTPAGRAGLEHELDGALLYLASDASSFVTGQTLVVDGGWTAR
jgi:NAD(P)-dependent dehydrogenase (short-subunit alcohol dehydrogenase family)